MLKRGPSKMNIISGESFLVVGLPARTSNAREMTRDAMIPRQWEQLMRSNALETIPNRVDSSIIALYTDYESDADGAYTYVLGVKVSSFADLPKNMISKEVPGGNYAVIVSHRGPVAEVVMDVWKRVWSDAELSGCRNYRTDFEVYDHRATNPQDAQVDIYIGVH